MSTTKVQIPEGMKDILSGECVRKRCVEQQLRTLFSRNGFAEIQTPMLEYYRAFDDAVYGFDAHHVWKTFDPSGRILILRPDNTIPAVRIAASRLKGEPLPLRLSYIQNVAAYPSEQSDALCESTQAGVEVMGESSALSDAEVIALSIESLKEAGLKEFQIDLGQVDFFKGFMQEAGLTPDQTEEFRRYVEEKNMLSMQLMLKECAIPDEVQSRLMKLPQLYGDESVLDEAQALTKNELCLKAIENLRRIIRTLEAYGCREYLSIDLGMVHAVNYYSGMIFRGITGYLGQPLLSGGRYDGLPKRFGKDMPATGFGLSIDLLMQALFRQGEVYSAQMPDYILGVAPVGLSAAVAWAKEKRLAGHSVSFLYDITKEDLKRLVLSGHARMAAMALQDEVVVLYGEEQEWR